MTPPTQPSVGKGLPRYALVGLIATLAHYLLLAALVEWAQISPWLASGFGAALGAQVAFVGNRRFTFQHRGPLWPAWWKFQGTAVLGAALGMALVAAGAVLGVHYLVAQAAATGLALLLTYAVNRAWSFAGPTPASHPPQRDHP
jgi:putative flippase GtrA